MALTNLKQTQTVALPSEQLCTGLSYWHQVSFTSMPAGNNERDTIKLASFYKESGN
jgi:hypothetical protein